MALKVQKNNPPTEEIENPITKRLQEANLNGSRQKIKRRGRPPKLESKTEKIFSYLDKKTHSEFQAECRRRDISESAVIRKLIQEHFLN